MKLKNYVSLLAFSIVVFGAFLCVQAQANYTVSAPITYKNLTVFLIHGKDETKNKNILTLQEALEKQIFFVYETSDVNELQVENKSLEYEVFIQSGDIVKGGKQDRVLAVDLIVPPQSGRISIEAFCVESGRWTQRGDERAGQFSSSNDRIVTKDLKIAANKTRSQGEVWDKVSDAQKKLSANVGGSVNSATSATSLQLSLENKKVVATTDEYMKKLSGVLAKETDVIGYAFVINGKINSADVYASSTLFKKLWSKLLKATAIEAVSETTSATTFKEVKQDDVSGFLTDSDKGKAEEKPVTKRVKIVTREDSDNIVFESRDEKSKTVIHKSYVKKQ